MNRRDLLKNLGLSAGAVISLPVWANAWSPGQIVISGKFDLAMLSAISGTFIPEGKTEPGAVGLEVDKFLDRLFADCYEAAEQQKIKKGMEALNIDAQQTFGKPFADCSQAQRENLLTAISLSDEPDKKWFYDTLRRETIRGYTTSEYVMVNKYNYVMAPGHYNGCVDIPA